MGEAGGGGACRQCAPLSSQANRDDRDPEDRFIRSAGLRVFFLPSMSH